MYLARFSPRLIPNIEFFASRVGTFRGNYANATQPYARSVCKENSQLQLQLRGGHYRVIYSSREEYTYFGIGRENEIES